MKEGATFQEAVCGAKHLRPRLHDAKQIGPRTRRYFYVCDNCMATWKVDLTYAA
ncbi:MAG: hypothetical protein AAB955_02595 [Patescibacteria group bacterium]